MTYRFTLDMWPSWVALLVLIALGAQAWRSRHEPGALPFALGCAFATLWAVSAIMTSAAVPVETQVFWVRFQALWHLPSAMAMTAFVLEYTWPGRWLTRRNLLFLAIPWMLTIAAVVSDSALHLMWVRLVQDGVLSIRRAPLGQALTLFGIGLALINVAAFAWLYRHSPEHRSIAALMIAFTVVGRLVYLADSQSGIFVIALMACMYAIALFGYRILDRTAIARRSALAQMADGMLVLDARGRVAQMNLAAQALLGITEEAARDTAAAELLSGFDGYPGLGPADGPCEIARGEGAARRYHVLDQQVLTDFRARPVGYLLLLHDVTEARRTEARVVQQQRALAILHEREQLARELHDSIGQVLGYAGLQVDTASGLIGTGRASDAGGLLDRLADVLREAHADVRQQILDLRAVSSPHEPLCAFVGRYLNAYAANYGIATALTMGDGTDGAAVPPDTQAQLCRILQEALANVRKHSGARRVEVAIACDDGALSMVVADNGRGFCAAQAAGAGAGQLGLDYMRQRAEQAGGTLVIRSVTGEGTTVSVTVPVGTGTSDAITDGGR